MTDYAAQRRRMVERQLAGRGVTDPLVLDAMATVPREIFVSADLRDQAYADGPLPIDAGQTISQPYIVAVMVEALELTGDGRVLEVGAGSGYAAAVLGQIAAEVYTIERHRELAETARRQLDAVGADNVEVICADGTRGWPERAPYDAIVVAAGAPVVPEALEQQLAIGGRLVIPVGEAKTIQELVRLTRVSETEYRREKLTDVRFVPLIGEDGWTD